MNNNALLTTKDGLAGLLHVGPREIDNVMARLSRFYRSKPIPKEGNKKRVLFIPMGRLRLLQDKILEHILSKVEFGCHLHGGVKGKSYITNASQHRGKEAVLKMDIADFFPSIRPEKILEAFQYLGFGGDAAMILTRLTTFKCQLPQGSPTSPALANLAFRRGDARLVGLARKHGFVYTRFVDDMAISGNAGVQRFRTLCERIVKEEGFKIKQGGSKVMTRDELQILTGCNLNWRLNMRSDKRKAILVEAIDALSTGKQLTPSLKGKLSSISAVNRGAARRLVKAAKRKA